jgi:nucleoside-diphosphate-sugar epimerase
MFKIVISGGSGFIGSNLVELLKYEYKVVSYDIKKPKISEHDRYWKNVDVLNKVDLLNQLLIDKPDYIVHLAARTDLDESLDINNYDVNISGVRNLMDAASQLNNLRRVVIASSMLVCRLGYNPNSFNDYAPNSLYGESKVLTEKIVKEYDLNWTIVRPTSIWGPWFGVPYKNFFELVVKGLYFNIPAKYASTKTYGYVENTCMQIIKLLMSEDLSVKHNYFYLGDIEPINITDWAIRIRKLNNQSNPLTLPKWLLIFAAKVGDFLKFKFGFYKFPMNSFRYNNMTNDNIIGDLKRTIKVTQIGAKSNLDNEIIKTLDWLKKNKNIKN